MHYPKGIGVRGSDLQEVMANQSGGIVVEKVGSSVNMRIIGGVVIIV